VLAVGVIWHPLVCASTALYWTAVACHDHGTALRVSATNMPVGCLAAQAWVDRKVARQGVASAMQAGQARDGGVSQLASIIGAATDPVHQLDTTLTPTKCS
jgi:hypothetical protein